MNHSKRAPIQGPKQYMKSQDSNCRLVFPDVFLRTLPALFFKNNVFAWRVCVTEGSLTHTSHARTIFLKKKIDIVLGHSDKSSLNIGLNLLNQSQFCSNSATSATQNSQTFRSNPMLRTTDVDSDRQTNKQMDRKKFK